MNELELKLAELKTALEASTDVKTKAAIEVQMKAVQSAMEAEVKKATDAADALKVELKSVTDQFDALKEDVKELKKKAGRIPNAELESKAALATELKEKKDALKAALKSAVGEVEIKADTLRSSIATNNHYFQVAGVGQLARVRRSLYNIFPKITVPNGNHNGTIAYTDWDEASIAKAAAMRAEGAAFPESTAAFKGYTLQLRKVGDSLPVSDEFLEDEEMAAQELALFVSANVESIVDNQLVNGDNTGQNVKGLLTSVDAYTAASSGIISPNVYDLIVKMKESITKTKGSKYQPDFAAMNETTMNTLVLKKDANYNYQFEPNHPIFDMIVVDNNMPDDAVVVGDSRFARIYEKSGVVLSRGEVGSQFTADMTTIKARKRLNLLIRAADKGGFAKSIQVATDIAALV